VRLFGFHNTIAHNMNTRGRVVTKVDPVVEAHKEGVGISGNDCEHCHIRLDIRCQSQFSGDLSS
jgi:hypothetical protein